MMTTFLYTQNTVQIHLALFDKEKFLLVFELDHSQAYKQYSDSTSTLSNFNFSPGGSIPKVQNITATTNSIGSYIHKNVMKPGDVMHYYYKENHSLSKSKGNMPKYNTFGLENTMTFQ